MTASLINWQNSFRNLFDQALKRYQNGKTQADSLFDAQDKEFLKSIGYTKQELFDFIEDYAKGGEPTPETALEIASVRRDYFLQEQDGDISGRVIAMAELPSKDAQVEGIEWLPRLMAKAEAKLRGEMPAELMYGCGGDRKFFRTQGLDPADFLRTVWQAHGDQDKIVAWVKEHRSPAKATK